MVIFNSRQEAGSILAAELMAAKPKLKNPIVLGIPRGGVPIGFLIAKALNCPLDAIVLRKLPIPNNPEAGFGAVTLDKTVIFNEALLAQVYLTKDKINRIVDNVYKEVLRRNRVYRWNKPFPLLEGRSVILTDDGLATGYTMLAAIKFAKAKGAFKTTAAVPVAHREAYKLVKKEADETIVLHISDYPFFAVASFYREFPDMSDEEVIHYLEDKEMEGGSYSS